METELTRCPCCHQPLQVTQLACPACDIRVQGQFERGCRFCALDDDDRRLLDVFLGCRGVVRDMERALGVSYPTVRARVDALLSALGYGPAKAGAASAHERASRRREILDALEAGTMTPDEAATALRELAG